MNVLHGLKAQGFNFELKGGLRYLKDSVSLNVFLKILISVPFQSNPAFLLENPEAKASFIRRYKPTAGLYCR